MSQAKSSNDSIDDLGLADTGVDICSPKATGTIPDSEDASQPNLPRASHSSAAGKELQSDIHVNGKENSPIGIAKRLLAVEHALAARSMRDREFDARVAEAGSLARDARVVADCALENADRHHRAFRTELDTAVADIVGVREKVVV